MAPLVSTFAPAGNYPSGLKKLQDGCPTERQLLRDLPAGLTGFVCRNDVGAQSVGYPSSLTGRAASGASCIACVSSCTSVTNVFDQKRSRATKESGSDQAKWPPACAGGHLVLERMGTTDGLCPANHATRQLVRRQCDRRVKSVRRLSAVSLRTGGSTTACWSSWSGLTSTNGGVPQFFPFHTRKVAGSIPAGTTIVCAAQT
jgi:hypothetical protein